MATVAVIGSRTFNDYQMLSQKLRELEAQHQFTIGKIISGGARGADSLAKKFATDNQLAILELKPDWSTGPGAGLMRNTDIVNASDIVVAFWDGKSRGTLDSITKGKRLGKQVHIVTF